MVVKDLQVEAAVSHMRSTTLRLVSKSHDLRVGRVSLAVSMLDQQCQFTTDCDIVTCSVVSCRVPLHLAASNGSQGGVYAAMSLIKANASCNLGDKFSQTPLHFACQQQLQFTAKFMVDHGSADPNLTDLIGKRPGDLLDGGMAQLLGAPSPTKQIAAGSNASNELDQQSDLPDGFSGGWLNPQLQSVMFDEDNPDPSPGPAGYSGLEEEVDAGCSQQ